jgi:TniQ
VSHIGGARTEHSTIGRRTLPIGVSPAAGEALESWLATLAKRLDISWGDLLALVLPTAGRSPRRFNLTAHLDETETVAISAATGVEQTTVEALTLARLDGALLTIDRKRHRVWSSWTPQRSRYCPHCLKSSDGRWQLMWRLPWVFACDEHACLLVDTCPTCGQFQRVSPWWLSPRTVPELERCVMTHNVGGQRVRCDGNLSAAATEVLPRDHPIAMAQARLSEVLSTSSTAFGIYHLTPTPTPSLQVLTDLRVLAARFLSIADAENIDELMGNDTVTSVREQFERLSTGGRNWTAPKGFATTAPAFLTGVGITLGLNVLSCTTLHDAAIAFRPIITHARASQRQMTPTTLRGGNLSSAMKALQLKAFAASFTPIDELR